MGPGASAILHLANFSASNIRSLQIWNRHESLVIPNASIFEVNSMRLFLCRVRQSIMYDSKILRSNDDGEKAYPDPIGLRTDVTMKL